MDEKRNELVNFMELEEAMLKIDNVLEPYNSVEKDLILKEYLGKRRTDKQSQMQSDMMGKVDFKSLMGRMMGKKKDD